MTKSKQSWNSNKPNRWGVILAGGDGVRLRPLTRFLCGDDRPKQFCPLYGGTTLLAQARKRTERSIPPERILYSLTRAHEEFYCRELADRTSQCVVQPENRGTAPGILSSLLCIADADQGAIVAVLPSDHHFSDESLFTDAMESAFGIAEQRRGSIVVLGAPPQTPEVEYGWIELGVALRSQSGESFRVRGFHEKPSLHAAQHLLRKGCLWNTFVMVGRVRSFLEMVHSAVPGLVAALRKALAPCSSGAEKRIADRHYESVPHTDFSRQILCTQTDNLVALRLGRVGWSDLGDPGRAVAALSGSGVDLDWMKAWRQAAAQAYLSREMSSAAVA